MRGDSARHPPVLFYNGRPTQQGFQLLGGMPSTIFAHLRRMAGLRPSDWFFNRALWHVWLGTGWLLNREDGYKESRDTAYRARVALGMLAKWRRAAVREGTSHPEARGLAPCTPSPDQKLLWAVHEQTDVKAIEEIMRKLLPTCGRTGGCSIACPRSGTAMLRTAFSSTSAGSSSCRRACVPAYRRTSTGCCRSSTRSSR
jgi:hypothetical protein